MKLRVFTLTIPLIAFFVVPVISHAQTIFGEGSELRDCMIGKRQPGVSPEKWTIPPGSCSVEQIMDLARNIVKWGAGISGALALFMFIIGGVWMVFSVGNQSRVQRGKDILTGTTIALIFILSSWLIINFILTALGSRFELKGDEDTPSSAFSASACCIAFTPTGPPEGGLMSVEKTCEPVNNSAHCEELKNFLIERGFIGTETLYTDSSCDVAIECQ
jgi:hypothetical protein